jgi:hypothetical protein
MSVWIELRRFVARIYRTANFWCSLTTAPHPASIRLLNATFVCRIFFLLNLHISIRCSHFSGNGTILWTPLADYLARWWDLADSTYALCARLDNRMIVRTCGRLGRETTQLIRSANARCGAANIRRYPRKRFRVDRFPSRGICETHNLCSWVG